MAHHSLRKFLTERIKANQSVQINACLYTIALFITYCPLIAMSLNRYVPNAVLAMRCQCP